MLSYRQEMSTQDELQQLMQSLDKLAVINQPDPQSFDENDEAKATSADMKSMKERCIFVF